MSLLSIWLRFDSKSRLGELTVRWGHWAIILNCHPIMLTIKRLNDSSALKPDQTSPEVQSSRTSGSDIGNVDVPAKYIKKRDRSKIRNHSRMWISYVCIFRRKIGHKNLLIRLKLKLKSVRNYFLILTSLLCILFVATIIFLRIMFYSIDWL